MASERNTLDGGPSNALVKRVRSVLWKWLRARPEKDSNNWKAAWVWANNVRYRGNRYNFSKRAPKWPSENEIATQYLMIVLLEMKSYHALRLPMYAAECVPEDLAQRLRLPGTERPALPMLSDLTNVAEKEACQSEVIS